MVFIKNISFYFLQFVIFCDLEWLPYLDLSLERPQVMSNLFVMLWKSLTSRLDGTIDLRGMNIQWTCIRTLQLLVKWVFMLVLICSEKKVTTSRHEERRFWIWQGYLNGILPWTKCFIKDLVLLNTFFISEFIL